ncbi:hypothetical protein KVT40_005275 [Elsinoe batatas]|uniref:Uncharacterized protein n=1 Tax=Elsinoe batatas TaxID=2601811 RepID=A0A8K0KZU6_9PEZI|nr:hypothetical protein KVT40_005275 [Elsinoe batatas]
MEVMVDSIYFAGPSDHTRPALRIHSRSNSVESIGTINSTSSVGSCFSPILGDQKSDFGWTMDALAKETMGLPIFISHSTGAPVTSGSPEASQSAPSATESTRSEEPMISGKRISQVLDFALTSLELFIVRSEELIVKSAGILLDTSGEEEEVQREADLESGRRESVCTAMRDKDGWVEGWLD